LCRHRSPLFRGYYPGAHDDKTWLRGLISVLAAEALNTLKPI
jgi:hypothetical protein